MWTVKQTNNITQVKFVLIFKYTARTRAWITFQTITLNLLIIPEIPNWYLIWLTLPEICIKKFNDFFEIFYHNSLKNLCSLLKLKIHTCVVLSFDHRFLPIVRAHGVYDKW